MRLLPPSLLLLGVLAFLENPGPAHSQVTVLTPGFTVRELPLKLSNLNNLRFAPDGSLTALGYDGRVWRLKDTDGDGLEDSANVFWDQPTLSVPVGMVWSKDGLIVSSHGKVSLLRDTDGDGKADVEEILANGWPPTDVASGGVDATAVAMDPGGNLYFGLLTADYSNPYRVKDEVSHYDLRGKRGTIQKWNAANRALETIATGIRVPYALRFNRLGDLFVTDQEGETWCPNGNPLDELNHVRPGHNYGFPPRHEKWLPGLVSEAPVVGFGPQHQSACGFVFNESSARQRRFGPEWWEGDAFVAGESRGKIWRVKLVKTDSGYVGREVIFARLPWLTTDVTLSPGGDLYVSCHSGQPDWGTGPNGIGRIFKISYTDPGAPQPVAIWVSGPMELNVAFDRAVDGSITNAPGAMRIEFGEYVRAADRLEVLKPPYQAVNRQESTPRGKLGVVSAQLSADGRTLTLSTDPHPQSVHYSVMLPGVKAPGAATSAVVDLDYTLGGVEAKWADLADPAQKGNAWLMHPNAGVNAAFLANSGSFEKWSAAVARPVRLTLSASLHLTSGTNIIQATSRTPFEMAAGGLTIGSHLLRGRHGAEVALNAPQSPVAFRIVADTGSTPMDLQISHSTEVNPEPRPLPFDALLVPWAPPPPPLLPVSGDQPELAGGDYERGRDLFFGEQAKCATCHRLRGEGGLIAPDLSNLIHRDATSVLRDIREPNATINPDYVTYNISLKDGGDLVGFVRAQDRDALRILAVDGKERQVLRAELKDLKPSSLSLMPSGLLDGLKEGQVRDLLTFLLNAAPTRGRAEVEALARAGGGAGGAPTVGIRPLRVVLVASKQDHGPGQHDYPSWQRTWNELLGRAPKVTVTNAWEWPTPEQFADADLIVCYFWNHDWSAGRYRQLDEFLSRGGGLAVFHSATIADQAPEQLAARIGLAAQPGPTKYLHTPMQLKFVAPTNHPMTRGFTELRLLDEPYWPMFGDTNRVEVLAVATQEGHAHPMIWTCQRGRGRVFASIPGHYTWTFADPVFRLLALRGLAWAAGESTGRFDGL